jgi:tetratricopeptide (TPR) repeat protein
MKRLMILLAITGMVACTSSDAPSQDPRLTELAEPRDHLIDEDLMLALAQAKNFHHKAKVYMADAKPDEAIAAVRQILSLRFPAGAPEAEDVRNDARAVLAKLLVGRDQLDEAMRVVEEGLATKTRDSFFVANLHTVKGEIHYARATKLGGDPAASAERRAAIEELDRSIKINEELLRRKDRR